MFTPRKRQRPNPDDVRGDEPSQARPPAHASKASEDASPPGRSMPQHPSTNGHGQETTLIPPHCKEIRKTQSWYNSWPRSPKASASTSVVKDNIHGGTYRSRIDVDLKRFDSRSDSKDASDTASVRSKLATSVAISDQAQPSTSQLEDAKESSAKNQSRHESTMKQDIGDQATNTASLPPAQQESTTTNPDQDAPPPLGWLDWLVRTSANATPVQEEQPNLPRPPEQIVETAQAEPSERSTPIITTLFGLWTAPTEPVMTADTEKTPTQAETAKGEDTVMKDVSTDQTAAPEPQAGSTWAFWSKATTPAKDKKPTQDEGEIAVIGQGSEENPLPINVDDISPDPKNDAKKKGKARDSILTWGSYMRSRALSIEGTPSPSPASSQLNLGETDGSIVHHSKTEGRKSTPKPESPTKLTAESEASAKQAPNLVLPSFSSTYCTQDNPSILEQITQFLLRTSQPPANHVFRVQETPKIRRALAIGVHGLLPATYLRPMIGQPTGTSLRFANLCADGIRRWADAHGCADCEIEKVALESEGRVGDRVESLWKLLLNWIDHIRKADLIVIASHSQGVPVSVILLEKLIDLGIITNAKIGVCAMAGVALGPFPDYKSSFLMGAAAELWDFGNPLSANSQRFEAALKRVLDHGARVTLIGSIDDQVVPMESAVYSPASHPYIYRAVFIDGRLHASDFIAHLVGFALKLRNLGVSDHGLVRELSLALAGSLYSGEGHSRLYYDATVYDLAIAHALETTSLSRPTPCRIEHCTVSTPTLAGGSAALASTNPYVLPWIMRGLLEEEFVKTELSDEAEELLRQFDDWKPTSKALKDVKYRLEAVRSKL